MADVVDLDEFLEDGWPFKIRGKTYTVGEVDWTEYLRLAQLQSRVLKAAAAGDAVVDGDQFWELAPRVLGPVLDELVADGVKGPVIALIARSAYFFQLGDRSAADAMLLAAGKARTPAETSSGSTSTTPTGSTSSASGSGTKRPASTTATRSPKKSSRRSPATKDATRTVAPV